MQGQQIIPQTEEEYVEEYPQAYIEQYYTPVLSDESQYCEENCKSQNNIENTCNNPYCCLDQSKFLYESRCTTGGFIDNEFYPGIQLRISQKPQTTGEPLQTNVGVNELGRDRKVNRTVSVIGNEDSRCYLPLGTTITVKTENEFKQYIVEDHHEQELSQSCLIKVFKGKDEGQRIQRQRLSKVYVTNIGEENPQTEEDQQRIGNIRGAYYYKKDISDLFTFTTSIEETVTDAQACEGTRQEKKRCLSDIFESNDINDGFYCEDVDPISQPVPKEGEKQEEIEESPEEIVLSEEDIPDIEVSEEVGPRIISESRSIQDKQMFWDKTKEISQNLNINPHYLAIVMLTETGSPLDHTAINGIGCAGLIQFCPGQGKGIDTLRQELNDETITNVSISRISAVNQLDYVETYLDAVMSSGEEDMPIEKLYLHVLYPSVKNADLTQVLNPTPEHPLSKQSAHLYNDEGIMTKLSIRAGLLKYAGVDEADNIPIPTTSDPSMQETPRTPSETTPLIDSPVFDISQYSNDQIKRLTEQHVLQVASCMKSSESACVCETGSIPRATFNSVTVIPRTEGISLQEFIPHNIDFRTGSNTITSINRKLTASLQVNVDNPSSFLQQILQQQLTDSQTSFQTQFNTESYYYIYDDKAYFLPRKPLWYNESRTEENIVLNALQEENPDTTQNDLIPSCQPEKQYFAYCAYPPATNGIETNPITYTLEI